MAETSETFSFIDAPVGGSWMMDDEDPEELEQDLLVLNIFPKETTEPQETKTSDATTSDQLEASSSTSAEEPQRVPSALDIWLSDPRNLDELCNTLLNLDCDDNLDFVRRGVCVLEIACKRLLPSMEDAAAVRLFLKFLEIFSKYHQLQDESPSFFFTVADGIFKCMLHLSDLQFNGLFLKEICCDMILACLLDFLINANEAQDTWPGDVALKANTMKVLQRLCAVCKNGENPLLYDKITKKLNDWLEYVFPYLFFIHSEVRVEALGVICTMHKGIPEEMFFGQPCWPKLKEDFECLYSKALSYLAQEDVPGWAEVWKFLLDIFDRDINARRNNLLINKLLEVEEWAFKSSYPEGRMVAFGCWKELVNRFLDTSSNDLIRWLRLILKPLISTNSKTEFVTHAKFDVLWYILVKLQPEIERVGDHVLPQFLTLCYAPADEFSLGTEYENSPTTPLMRDECSMLVPLLDAITQLLNPDCGENTVDSFVLPCFTKPFIPNPQFFVKHSKLLFLSVAECTVVVGKSIKCQADDERLRHFYVSRIWKNLMYQVEGAFKIENKTVDEKNSVAELMKNLLMFLQFLPSIKLEQICMNPILETVLLGDNRLPLAVLYSKLFAVNSNSPCEGTPLNYLVNLILSPQLLESNGSKYGYLSILDHLLKAGIGKLSMTVKFTEAVLRTLEISVSKREPHSKLPMAVEAWLIVYKYVKSVIAAGFLDHLAKDDASFQWLYSILLFPVKFMNLWEDYQVNMLLNGWTYIAFLFGRTAIASGKGDNFLCEKLCHFIQTNKEFKWDKLTFEDLHCLVRMYAVAIHLVGEINPSCSGAERPQMKLKYSVMVLKRILVTFQRVSTDSRAFMDFTEKVMICTRNVLRKVRGQCKEASIWSFSPKIVDEIIFMINHLSVYTNENTAYIREGVSLVKEYSRHFGQIPVEALLRLFHSLLSHPSGDIKGQAVALWREKHTALFAKSRVKSRSLKTMLEECKKIVEQAPPSVFLPYCHNMKVSPKVEVQLIPQMDVQPSALTQEFNWKPSCSSPFQDPLSVIGVRPMIDEAAVVDIHALPQSSNQVPFTEPLQQSSNCGSPEEGSRKRAAGRPLTRHQIRKLKERRDDIPALYTDLSQDTQWTCASEESSQLVIPERFKPVQVSSAKPVENTPDHEAQSSRSKTSTKKADLDLREKEELVACTLQDMINLASVEKPANPESDSIQNLKCDGNHPGTPNTENAISVDPKTDLSDEEQIVHILNSLLNSACSDSQNMLSINLDSSVLAANSENNPEMSCSVNSNATTSGCKPTSVVSSHVGSERKPDNNICEKTPVEVGSGQRRKAFKPKKLDIERKNRGEKFIEFEEPVQLLKQAEEKQALDPIEESLHLLFDDKSECDASETVVASHDVIDSREALRAILEDHAPESQCITSTTSKSRMIFPERQACKRRKSGIKYKHRFKPRRKCNGGNTSTRSVSFRLPLADVLDSSRSKGFQDHSHGSRPKRMALNKAKQTMQDVHVSHFSQNLDDEIAENDLELRYELRSKEKSVPNDKSSAEEPVKDIHGSTNNTAQRLNKELVSPSKATEGNCSLRRESLSSKSSAISSIEPCFPEAENTSTNIPCDTYTAFVDQVVSKNSDVSNVYPTESEHPSPVEHNRSADSGINISDEFELEQIAGPGTNHTVSRISQMLDCESIVGKQEAGCLPVESMATKSKRNRKRTMDNHSSIKDSNSGKKSKISVDLKRAAATKEECTPVSKRLRSSFKHSDLCLSQSLSNIQKDPSSNTSEQNGKSSQRRKPKSSRNSWSGDRTSQQPMLKYIIPLYRQVTSQSSMICNQQKPHEIGSSLHPQLEQSREVSPQSESSCSQGLAGNLSRSYQSFSEESVACSQEHSREKIELMRQLSLIPQLHSSCALNENLLSLNTLGTERDTLEVISSEVAPNDEVCIENNQSVQEHDNHNENNLSGVEIDKISQKLNLPIEETSNSSVNKDSNHDLIGLNIDSEGLAVSRTLDQNMPVESNVCLLQREGITRGMNNGIPERRKCGKQPEDSHIVVEKITSVGEESQSDFEDCCIVSEVNLGTSDNTTKCVFHALGIPGCCQVQDSLLPNSEEKNKLDNSTANMYKKECAYPDEQHCITKNRSSSSTGSSREVCSNKENTVLDSMPAELDPEEPGPSHRLRIGEIPFEKSSDPSCSIIEPDNADSDERCSRRANNEPDFRVQNVLYSYDKEDFSTSVWSPLKWNPRAQPLKSALKKADGRRELSYRPQVKIRNENITKFLTYHRLPEEPIGNIARVNDSVIPVDERFPVRFTRGMAKHIEKIKTANEALTEWLRQCWDSLSDRAREAIRENRRDLGLADDVYVLGCNEDDCSHDEQPEDNLVIVNETVDDEGEIQIVAYKFNTIEDDFVVHAPEIMSDELTKNISSYEDSSVIHMDQNPSEKMPKGPVSTDSSSVRCTSIKEEELASLQSSAMEETVEQCPVESVSGSLTCHPNDPVKEEPTGQICVDIPMACHQSDSSRPAVKSETLGEEPGDEQAISAELFCLLSDQSMETSVKQETMMNQDPLELNLIDFASMYPMLDRAMQTVEEETPLKCHMKDASVQTSVEWKTVKKMIFSPTRCLKDASVQTLPEDETQMETVLTGSKYLLTDASVQTSTEGETQTQDISVALKRILIDASVQASTVGNDISLQTEMVGNDTSVQTEIFGNDTSVQTETVGNDTSVQTEIVGNDMSVQTEIVGNDMSVQTEIVGNDMSVQTEIVGNDMSVQTEIIGNDMSVQTEIVGKDASVQISADLTDAAVQTSSEVAQMEELAAALKNFLNDVSNQVSRMSANALVQRLIEEETQVEGLGSEGNLPSTSKAFHKEASVQKNVEPASLSNSNHEQLPVVDLQHSGESSSGRVASEPRDTEGPFYPPLMDCEDFAANLVHDLTEPHRAVVLVRKMVELRIATIGDFCSESPSVISQLPLKEPKLATALAALKNYENQKSPEEKVSRIEAVNIPGCQLNHQSEEPVTSGRIPVITRVESLRTLTPSYAALISYREALEFWRGNRNQIESGERAENVQEENTPVLASHSQFSQGSVEDMHSDMISSEEPIFPALQNCSDDINNIIGDLTDTIWSKPLIEKLEENGIFTVGDLCSKSAAYVLQLPVKEPKLSSTLQVLENYYNSRFEKETKVFDQSEEDVIPSSQGSSGSTAVNLEELVANIPANQLVQAILASPQRMECVSELVHAIGSVEKVMQFLVDVKVTEVLNEYWKRIREPLQERFSHDVVEFVTKRVLASTGPDNSNSLLVNPRSFSKTNKPGLTLRSRQSLQTMVKKHGWTAVCKLIPDHELKRFLSSCNFDTLKQLFPPHVLSEYIQREIRRDKIFCKQIIQMALNAHLPTAQNDATSLWNTVTRDMCCNEEQYQLVKEFILRPDTLNFIAQMTELLTLLKPVCEKGQTLSTNSRSILPDGVLRNLLKIVHKQMQPKDFISACSKSMMDIL